ncbi:acyl carrier protein [uncultured Clostridium sp.]|uniref:acyl carrier protein n=1 Tax=uncultured Clostridium sp. TaxID=59620 RepID=UPI0025FBF932|nr:acyl carrier protein [uncultured Clostridium sp.]
MNNLERYNKIFMDVFRKKEEELKGLKYGGFDLWDSIGHMDLVAELEEAFEIRLETSDMLDLTSYEKGMEVLAEYGVVIEEAEKA